MEKHRTTNDRRTAVYRKSGCGKTSSGRP